MAILQQGRPPFHASTHHGRSHRKFAGHQSGWQTQLDNRETSYGGPGLRNASPPAPLLEFDEADVPKFSATLEKQGYCSQSPRPRPRALRWPGFLEYGFNKCSRSQDAFVRRPVLAAAPERCHLSPAASTPP